MSFPSTSKLLVFLKRAKRENPSAFTSVNPSHVQFAEDLPKSLGADKFAGFLYEHTRGALVAYAQTLGGKLTVRASATKAEIIGLYIMPKMAFPPVVDKVDIDLVGDDDDADDGGAKFVTSKSKRAKRTPPPPSSSKRAKTSQAVDRKSFGEAAKALPCVICMEQQCNTVVLCCMSSYHVHCLAQWLEKGNSNCPSCRADIHWQLEKKRPAMEQLLLPLLTRAFLAPPSVRNDFDSDEDDDDDEAYWCEVCGDYHRE